MYNFNLEENEKIERIFDDILLKINNDIKSVSVIITNIRFIILSIPSDIESFRVGRMINYPNFKEVIFECNINDIINIEKENNYYKYILSNTNYFLLNTNEIYKFINQNK